MKTIKVQCINIKLDDFLRRFPFLTIYYKFELSKQPEYVIVTNDSKQIPNVKGFKAAKKLLLLGELIPIDMNIWDYVISCYYIKH